MRINTTLQMNREQKKIFNKELLTLAIPLALQSLLQALVGASDALLLGRLTQEAIAAVSLANQISFIMTLFTSAFIWSASVLMAQYMGKEDRKTAVIFYNIALRITLLITAVFTIGALCAPEFLLSIFTKEEELIRIGAGYLRIVGISYIFSGLSQCYLMVMKLQERTTLSVIIPAMMVIVDMIADYILIYGAFGVSGIGVNGCAYSTIAVEVLAFLWLFMDAKMGTHIRPDWCHIFQASKEHKKSLVHIATGMLASSLSWGLSVSMHSLIMGHLSTDAVAAASITNVALSLIRCIVQGVSAATGVIIGKLLGANELTKAEQYGNRLWLVSVLVGFINIGLLLLIGPLVVTFYVLEAVAKEYLIQMLLFSAIYTFCMTFSDIIVVGIFPAGGDSKYDAVSVIIATWLFAIPLACMGCFIFHWPVMVVYVVMCMDEIVKIPFIWPRYKKKIWLRNLTK